MYWTSWKKRPEGSAEAVGARCCDMWRGCTGARSRRPGFHFRSRGRRSDRAMPPGPRSDTGISCTPSWIRCRSSRNMRRTRFATCFPCSRRTACSPAASGWALIPRPGISRGILRSGSMRWKSIAGCNATTGSPPSVSNRSTATSNGTKPVGEAQTADSSTLTTPAGRAGWTRESASTEAFPIPGPRSTRPRMCSGSTGMRRAGRRKSPRRTGTSTGRKPNSSRR